MRFAKAYWATGPSQIEQHMLTQASERESRLLNANLAACRRAIAPHLMVLALCGDVVVINQRQLIRGRDVSVV